MQSTSWRTHLRAFERVFVSALPVIVGLGLVAELAGSEGASRAWVSFASLSYEQNLPTWYATVLLVLAALALADASRDDARHARGFARLASVFVYISLDEAVELHEHLAVLYEGSGVLYFGWVVPGAIIVTAGLVVALPLLRALPADTRVRFIVAGAVYVGGALLMELPLGYVTERYGDEGLAYGLVDLVEETLELVGVSIFLVAVRRHIALHAHRP